MAMRPINMHGRIAERVVALREHVGPKGLRETLTGGSDAWRFDIEDIFHILGCALCGTKVRRRLDVWHAEVL